MYTEYASGRASHNFHKPAAYHDQRSTLAGQLTRCEVDGVGSVGGGALGAVEEGVVGDIRREVAHDDVGLLQVGHLRLHVQGLARRVVVEPAGGHGSPLARRGDPGEHGAVPGHLRHLHLQGRRYSCRGRN